MSNPFPFNHRNLPKDVYDLASMSVGEFIIQWRKADQTTLCQVQYKGSGVHLPGYGDCTAGKKDYYDLYTGLWLSLKRAMAHFKDVNLHSPDIKEIRNVWRFFLDSWKDTRAIPPPSLQVVTIGLFYNYKFHTYCVFNLCKMKDPKTGKWLDAVEYEQTKPATGQRYVRTLKDFKKKFTLGTFERATGYGNSKGLNLDDNPGAPFEDNIPPTQGHEKYLPGITE